MSDDRPTDPFANLPDQDADPVVWDPATRRFVPKSEVTAAADQPAPTAPPPPAPAAPVAPGRDSRKFYVGAPEAGQAPPPRQAVAAPPVVPTAPPPPAPAPDRPPAPAPAPMPRPRPDDKRRWPKLRRPKLKWVLLVCGLLPILLVIGGLVYADMKFRQVQRVPVGDLLSSGGSGENILIVGSDTRANADPNAPNAAGILGDETDRPPSGERADTIMVLRLEGSGAKMLSIPRDLVLPIAETGGSDRINAAYNANLGGGPGRLLKTVQQSLGIPIHRYMEVDFVTFAGLVDAVGGVKLNFPFPAFDENTGLDVQQSGDVELNGEQALAYVRSRHYTEIREDGRAVADPTADLGRVQRQQQFLRAVMGKVAGSKNPITLLRVGGQVADGIRVDDDLGLWGAMQLAWDLRGIEPEGIPLPVVVNRDGATLRLVEPDAQQVIAQFQ